MGNAKPVTVARPDPVTKSYAVGALETAYRRITELVASLDDAGFDGPSRCVGWSRRDLLFHVLLDAQRALVSFASPDPGPPDTDYVGYWSAYVSGRTTSTRGRTLASSRGPPRRTRAHVA